MVQRRLYEAPDHKSYKEPNEYGHLVIIKFVGEDGKNIEVHGVGFGRSKQLAKTNACADACYQLFPKGFHQAGK
jgi:hypothetical protein